MTALPRKVCEAAFLLHSHCPWGTALTTPALSCRGCPAAASAGKLPNQASWGSGLQRPSTAHCLLQCHHPVSNSTEFSQVSANAMVQAIYPGNAETEVRLFSTVLCRGNFSGISRRLLLSICIQKVLLAPRYWQKALFYPQHEHSFP